MKSAKLKSRTASQLPPLPEHEVQLAAKLFTVSNLGQPLPPAPRTVKAIERAYFECRDAHAAEGLDIGAEFKSWLKIFRSKDADWRDEWRKEKESISDLGVREKRMWDEAYRGALEEGLSESAATACANDSVGTVR